MDKPQRGDTRADPPHGSPVGLPSHVVSAQKKETPGEAPGVGVLGSWFMAAKGRITWTGLWRYVETSNRLSNSAK